MKTCLTQSELELMPIIRNEYIDRALKSDGSINMGKATKWIEYIYGLSGLDKPIVIKVNDPYEAQMAANIVNQKANIRDQVWDQVGSQVMSQVWSQVSDQVRSQVRDQVGSQVMSQVMSQVRSQVMSQVRSQVMSQVWSQVSDQVRSQVMSQVRSQVGSQVMSQVMSQVRDQVRSQVGAHVGDQVRDQVRSQVGSQVMSQVGSQVWSQVSDQVGSQVMSQVMSQVGAHVGDQVRDQVRDCKLKYYDTLCRGVGFCSGWISYYSYFQDIGINTTESFKKYSDLLNDSGVWNSITLKGVAIIYGRPNEVRRDANNRLHCDQDAAIVWPSGYCQYYLKGVCFDEITWRKIITHKFEISDLAKINNADARAVALSMLRPDLLLEHVNAVETHIGIKGTKLYAVPNFMDTGEDQFCMLMECPSTGRNFIEWVEPEIGRMNDADLAQANAWKDENGKPLSRDEYLAMEEA